jgi:hypothetical protein
MLEFLKRNPEFQLNPTGHSSISNLFNTFNVKPVLQMSLHIGTKLPFVTFVNPVKTQPLESPDYSYTSNPANLYLSFEAKYSITRDIEINAEAVRSYKTVAGASGFIIGDINLKNGISMVIVTSGGISIGSGKLIISND